MDVSNRDLAPLERYQAKPHLKSHKDPAIRGVLRSIARKWLPLSNSVLQMCVDQLPSPVEAQRERIEKLWRSLPPSSPPALLEERKRMFVYFSLVP